MLPGLIALAFTLRHVPPMPLPPAHERSTWATLRPAVVPLSLLYFTISVLRTATTYGFMTFAPTLLTQAGLHDRRGKHGGVDLPVRQRCRRLHRRAAGRSLRSAPVSSSGR